MAFSEGDIVRHISRPEWGSGKVLEAHEDKVRVHFEHPGEKMISLDNNNPRLEKTEADDETRALLESLTAPGQRKPSSKAAAAKKKKLKYDSFQYLVDAFLGVFKEGFQGQDYMDNERGYKLKACDAFQESLAPGAFAGLINDNHHQEICARAKGLINKSNLLHHHEITRLSNALKSGNNQEMFARTLHTLLYGQDSYEIRFKSFVKALEQMDSSAWTIATYFPYLMDTSEHLFMKPKVTQNVALACGFELNYSAEPNWITYRRLMEFGQHLFEQLEDLSPLDMIDVQSFIWSAPMIADGVYVKRA